MDEVELRVEIELLKVFREADRMFLLGIAAAMARPTKTNPSDIIEVLEATTLYATAIKGENVGKAVHANLELLRPMIEDVDPVQFMKVAALSLLSAGSDHRDAQIAWWQQATPDEISEDLRSLFERLAEGGNGDDERPDE